MTGKTAVISSNEIKPKTVRLRVRVNHDLLNVYRHAAEIQGLTLNDFVAQTLKSAAFQTIDQAELVLTTTADQKAFAQALIEPAKSSATLRRAFTSAKQLLAGS